MYFTAVCFATLMTRAVRARVVANNPSIAKSKFQAEWEQGRTFPMNVGRMEFGLPCAVHPIFHLLNRDLCSLERRNE